MTDKNEDTGQGRGIDHDDAPDQIAPDEIGAAKEETGTQEVTEKDPADAEDSAGSGFTDAQLAELHSLLASQGQSGLRGRVRGWLRKNRARAREFIQTATPPDEVTDFDEDTFAGWLAARAAKHRGVTAVLVLVGILVLGGLWATVLGGGIPLPVAGLIAVIVLSLPVAAGVLFRRRRQ